MAAMKSVRDGVRERAEVISPVLLVEQAESSPFVLWSGTGAVDDACVGVRDSHSDLPVAERLTFYRQRGSELEPAGNLSTEHGPRMVAREAVQ